MSLLASNLNAVKAWVNHMASLVVEAIVIALPLWFLWTFCGLGEKYFSVPVAWQRVPFWNLVGILVIVLVAIQLVRKFFK